MRCSGPVSRGTFGLTPLADVGGAQGHLIAMILDRYPGMRGVLFDQPHAVTGAGEFLRGTGHAERIEVVTLPSGADPGPKVRRRVGPATLCLAHTSQRPLETRCSPSYLAARPDLEGH